MNNERIAKIATEVTGRNYTVGHTGDYVVTGTYGEGDYSWWVPDFYNEVAGRSQAFAMVEWLFKHITDLYARSEITDIQYNRVRGKTILHIINKDIDAINQLLWELIDE